MGGWSETNSFEAADCEKKEGTSFARSLKPVVVIVNDNLSSLASSNNAQMIGKLYTCGNIAAATFNQVQVPNVLLIGFMFPHFMGLKMADENN